VAQRHCHQTQQPFTIFTNNGIIQNEKPPNCPHDADVCSLSRSRGVGTATTEEIRIASKETQVQQDHTMHLLGADTEGPEAARTPGGQQLTALNMISLFD
jgi:hypothetical protein